MRHLACLFSIGRKAAGGRRARLLRGRQGFVGMEFAIVSVPFFILVLGVLEVSYDLYTQVALDAGLYKAVRELQTGNAQNVTNANAFVSQYLCPSLNGLLECNGNLYIYVTKFVSNGTTDFYDATTPSVLYPVSGNTITLPGVYSAGTSFCNVSPQSFILVSAVYLGPSFVGGLLPGILTQTYGGNAYHVTLSSTGLATEKFSVTTPGTGQPVAATC